MNLMSIPVLALDIETDTNVTASDRSQGITKKGLDPAFACVTDVAITGAGWSKVFTGAESTILCELEDLLHRTGAGILVTWNGAVFDLPFLKDRYAINGLRTSLMLEPDPTIYIKYEPTPGHLGGYRASWAGLQHVDIMPMYAQEAVRRGVRHSLKPVFEAVVGERPIEVDRTQMHLLTDAERTAYAASDTSITRRLALRPEVDLLAHLDVMPVTA